MGSHSGYSKLVKWLLILVTTAQCSSLGSGVESDEILRPLKSVRKAVYYVFKGRVKRKSRNGRTYYSEWHRPGKSLKLSAYKQKERARLEVTILGDRRPYQVAVAYRVEELSGRDYELKGYDMNLAKKYLREIEDFLAARPEERDVIDDFRPY